MCKCEKCWESPCICGYQGYTVVSDVVVDGDDAKVIIDVIKMSGIMDTDSWKVITGLSNMDTNGKNHLTKMKEYHMLKHLSDQLTKEVEKRTCDILNSGVDTERQSTKLNNKLKMANAVDNGPGDFKTIHYTVPKFDKGDTVIKINNDKLKRFRNGLINISGDSVIFEYSFDESIDRLHVSPVSFEWIDKDASDEDPEKSTSTTTVENIDSWDKLFDVFLYCKDEVILNKLFQIEYKGGTYRFYNIISCSNGTDIIQVINTETEEIVPFQNDVHIRFVEGK